MPVVSISAVSSCLPSSVPARKRKRQSAAAIVEAARSLALETGVASVTLTGVANRAGVHYSAVRAISPPARGAPASRSRRSGAVVDHGVREVYGRTVAGVVARRGCTGTMR